MKQPQIPQISERHLRLGPAAERVFQELRNAILKKFLPPYSRLPTERELCAKFNLSRNTVRKAIMRLQAEGFVETRRKSGSHVRPLSSETQRANIVSLMFMGSMAHLTFIQDLLLQRGFTLVLYSQTRTHWDVKAEADFLRQVKEQRHQALLAFCSPLLPNNEGLLAEVAASGTRVVHIEPYSVTAPAQDFLMPDYARAGYAAAAALIAEGFRNLRYLGMDSDGPAFQLQRQGFLDAIRDLLAPQARFEEHYVCQEPELTEEALLRLAAALKPPVGIVCGSPCRGRTALRALRQAYGCVPNTARVIAIEQPAEEMEEADAEMDCLAFPRRQMFERLIEAVTAPQFSGMRDLVPPRLLRRREEGEGNGSESRAKTAKESRSDRGRDRGSAIAIAAGRGGV
ncbi:MAG: GntR family transcriptional regulator [Planctomycetota bacterium]|nr:GntR family transcriptional regulator [Planctomycetota bacterium]